MPRIEVMNIKFNLDSNEIDAEVYAALCDIPRGKRSSVVKELLHAVLCLDEAASLQIHERTMSLPKRCDKPDRKVVPGSQVGRPLPRAASPTPIRKTYSDQMEGEKASATTAVAVKTAQPTGDTKELDEFRFLIY